ncbi:MAG: alpha-glucan phosphorylase, partial [Clostridia bacterium]|nr:alpha-glucan phosphorylase [Clostridia bacterium]
MANKISASYLEEALNKKISRYFGISQNDADINQIYQATVLTVRDILATKNKEFMEKTAEKQAKEVYYMCMEFLIGRSLKMNLCNLGIENDFK